MTLIRRHTGAVAVWRAAVGGSAVWLVGCFYVLYFGMFCRWSFPNSSNNVVSYPGSSPVRLVMVADPQIEGWGRLASEGFLGTVNNVFNDYYYRHIVSTNVRHYIQPSHMVVLGDLFSSQYISDAEFDDRVARLEWAFGKDMWFLAGNHDIGYDIDISHHRIDRFERIFGKQNAVWEVSTVDGISILFVRVNGMLLDAESVPDLTSDTWKFVKDVAVKRKEKENTLLLLFMHIPLYKPVGSCPGDVPEWTRSAQGHMVDQTVLRPATSDRLLQALQPHAVFVGHDHVGCVYSHVVAGKAVPEFSVRSMLADHGGFIALFEVGKAAEDGGTSRKLVGNAVGSMQGILYRDKHKTLVYSFRLCSFVHHVVLIAFFICGGLLCLFWIVYCCWFVFHKARRRPVKRRTA